VAFNFFFQRHPDLRRRIPVTNEKTAFSTHSFSQQLFMSLKLYDIND